MKAAVLTVSDGVLAGTREDTSGDVLQELLEVDGYEVVRRAVADERDEIAGAIEALAGEAQLVLTTGGTGVAPRDVTPEATRSVLDREAPGIAEAIRADSLAKTPHALLSRGARRDARRSARRQPPGLAGRLPRRVRGDPAGARHTRCVCCRMRRRSTPDVIALPAHFARLVKIEHTVFALPFAYVGAFLAVDAVPSAADLFWITLAMVGARSLAMALNRLIDAELDARNPRTATRELPAGRALARAGDRLLRRLAARVPRRGLAARPDRALALADPGRAFVVYPYLKRVHLAGHLWLGAVDGLAPVGAWVALTGTFAWEAWALGAAVACWVAGFDLFYALLDLDVDRREGLHSWATRFGVRGVFAGARVLHVLTVAFLAAAGLGLDVGAFYWLGVLVVAALLVYEHSLIRPDDLRRLDAAFFTVNGVISVALRGLRAARRARDPARADSSAATARSACCEGSTSTSLAATSRS